MNKASPIATFILLILIVAAIIAAPLRISSPQFAWVIIFVLFLGLTMVLGAVTTGSVFGALIDEHNLMSLSRFQAVAWTLIILSSYFIIIVARVKAGKADPLNVQIDNSLLVLMGITATSLVGAPLINTTKLSQTPANGVTQSTVDALAANNNVPNSQQGAALVNSITNSNKGILYANPRPSDASFWDMFEGDELGNTAAMDFGKVQLFYFTLIALISYVYYLWLLLSKADSAAALPVLPSGMITLMGISNAGFLGNKAVKHTPTQ